uniref:Ribonuclease P/MRP protein subunit POP5 n=1 Tax=Lotharella oceanica TaxID=641309 RepID=A0A7S2TH41_9EUKA|mmetsp:Transcript_14017/g.26746  ORF Transcript_14017/g.26746 Transcript_14017/m.26746 type:complete len:168 (+) Transcript_14017:124-627(+)
MRFKNRYILFEVMVGAATGGGAARQQRQQHQQMMMTKTKTLTLTKTTTLSRKVLWKLIKESIEENFGDFGCSKLLQTLSIKFYGDRSRLVILKVDRDLHHIAWAAISFITCVKTEPITIRSVAVSGHLAQCCKTASAFIRNQMAAKDCREEMQLALNFELKDLSATK